MSNKQKLENQNIRLSLSDKKKARALGLNVSEIARKAIKTKICYLTYKAKKEQAKQATPITRPITPDQVTLAGAPAIAEPAEAILDAAIKDLKKKEEKDPNRDPDLLAKLTNNHSCEDGSDRFVRVSVAGVDHNAIV